MECLTEQHRSLVASSLQLIRTRLDVLKGGAQSQVQSVPLDAKAQGTDVYATTELYNMYVTTERQSTVTGLYWWTVLVDWTGGLIEIIRQLVPMHEL